MLRHEQTKRCPKCERELPLRQFNRPLTIGQAVHRGYSGKRPVLVESKFCVKCQPGSRYRALAKTATKKQIETAVWNQRITRQQGEALLKAKAHRAAQATRRGRKWAAVKVAVEYWEKQIEALRERYEKARQRRFYLLKRKGGTDVVEIAQLREQLRLMKLQLSQYRLNARAGEPIPEGENDES